MTANSPILRALINPATGLALDFYVDIEDVAFAAGISERSVRSAIAKTVKQRGYKWRGRRLQAHRVLTKDGRLTSKYSMRISSLSDALQIILIAELRASLAARLAGCSS